jgi:hypothetical protein
LNRLLAVLWIASSLVVSTPHLASAQATPAAPAPAPVGQVEIEVEDEPVATPAPPVEAAPPAEAAPAAPPEPPAVSKAEVDALVARIEALEARSVQQQTELEAAKARAAAADAEAAKEDVLGWSWGAYVQAQYESSQISENQLQTGGALLNRDRFVVRRARFRLDHDWEYAALAVEIDTETVQGLQIGVRRAEAEVRYPARSKIRLPYVAFRMGIQDQPFGHELTFGARRRLFADRSIASNAFFPAEADVGASLSGGYGVLRYAVALLNGEPGGPYQLTDPNAGKDLLTRVGIDVKPIPKIRIAAGVSFLRGRGFSPGEDETKGEFQWIDDNQDNTVQNSELRPIGALAVEPSESFDRWAVGFDAFTAVRTPLGLTKLYGELTLAQNLDRGLFVADPVQDNGDARELGYYIALTQEISPYAIVGFRLEYYDGNADFIEGRRGRVVPASRSITMYSPVVGVQLPKLARLSLQYDFIDDALGRDDLGVPTDLRNDQWTLRLQVGL